MIGRTLRGTKAVVIGITKAEVDALLADKDKSINLQSEHGEIMIYVVDGDDAALEQEFLRIVAINSQPQGEG